MTTNNRRKFLKSSLLALGSAPLLAASLHTNSNNQSLEYKKDKLLTRKFGKTGLELPLISMGTGDTNNPKLVEAALEKGIVMLATSQYYGNGNNEKMLGELLKTRKRDSFLIATSAMPDGFDHKTGMFAPDATADGFMKKFEGSLDRLGVENVDIMFLPFVAKKESVFFEPYLNVMEKIKKSGKARFIGIATHKFEDEAIRAAVDVKIYDLVMTAYNFRRKNLTELNDSISYAAKAGLGIIAMKTMAGAFWDKERTKPINTKASLKWVLQNENIHTTVPGFTTFDQLQQNIDILSDLQLTEQEKSDLIAFDNNQTGIYCQQCGECIPQCSKQLDIPTIMRSYMYAYGYKNLKFAQETLNYAKKSTAGMCNECSICTVFCQMNFDIKSKIADITRLYEVPVDLLS